MQKVFIAIALLFVFTTANAQKLKINGQWLLTGVEAQNKTMHPYQLFEFREDGKFMAMGMEAGTWKQTSKTNQIVLRSKMDKDFNGTGRIVRLTAEELVMNKDGGTYYYTRVHPKALARANAQSGLIGSWSVSGTDYPAAFLKFEAPDVFSVVQISDVEKDENGGTWIFNPGENAIIFISFSHLLRGKVPLSDLNKNGFMLKLADRMLKAQRLKTDVHIERLSFSEDDFPEDAEPNESKLPWRDFEEMAQTLSNVEALQYSYGKLLEDFNTLTHTSSILSKIKVDTQKPSVRFTNFSVSNGQSSQFSENYKGGLTGRYNAFFPKDEPWPYRFKGVGKVTVPAGTFNCTVIEAVDGEKKLKYWMINDMPGIYAKIIREETDPFGKLEYSVQELDKITNKKEK